MDGANVDHLQRKLVIAKVEINGQLDLGPCMAQTRRYKNNRLQWPPTRHVGGYSSRPGITGSAAADAFFNFLVNQAVGHYRYRKLCDDPQTEHHFLPKHFTKGDPFNGITLQFTTYLKCFGS